MSEVRKGLLALSPLLVFLGFFLGGSLIAGDFTKIPIAVAFLVASIYAVAITRDLSLPDRVRRFGRGAGASKVMFMIWIFLSAGCFASSAQEMGCIEETVDCILKLLPSRYIYVSIFLAGCLISMATGSGIGSIVALCPVAVGIGEASGVNMSLLCAIVVSGAMFGDNLSFISDTTIIATTTQGCKLSDKFKVNFWIALPAAIAVTVLYFIIGKDIPADTVSRDINVIKILPYIVVIVCSIAGGDVLMVLTGGTLLCGVMGMCMGEFGFYEWLAAMDKGLSGMGPIIIIIIMASGLMELVAYNGGMDYLVKLCTKFVRSRRSAEVCIALLTGLVCVCTSNNTIAIMTVASIVKDMSDKSGVDPRKAASLMDTSSCVALELVPYGTHLLVAAAFAGVTAASLIPFMFYAFALLVMMVISIIFSFPRQTR